MMKRCLIIGIFVFCAAGLLFSQDRPKAALGMEPTPKNFDAAIASATARAGQVSIPPQIDLSARFPRPGYQGEQQSCVAWATGYAVKSYHENLKNNWGLDSAETIFSPSFIYNQINNGQDSGSTIPDAMELVKSQGSATLKTMPYGDYRQKPGAQARIEAAKYKAASYERLDGKNTNSLKVLLAAGNPIIIGMKTYENFMTYSGGVYKKTSGAYLGGHAMVIVGYDDAKQAFKIMNSWSDRWGEEGFAWYDYQLFGEMNHTAMVLYDQPSNTPAVSYPPNSLTASAGAYADKIQVSWEAVRNADYYIVFRAEQSPNEFVKIAEIKGTTFIDSQARQKTNYFYSVKSFGPGGESDFSSTAMGNLKEGQKPGTPRGLKGVYASGRIRLIWDSVQGAEGYYIYRWDNAKEQWVRVGLSKNEGFEDAAVPSGSMCERYVVTAYARAEESASDSALAVAIPPPQKTPDPPAAPASVNASQGTSRDKIDISWSRVSGADSYILRKWSDAKKDWTEIARTRALSYADTNVPEKRAMYSVVAVQGSMTGEASAIAEGWLSTASKKPEPKKNFADDTYREDFFTRAEKFFGDDKFFSDDKFFTDASTFFDDFEEKNFFFFDEKAFFQVDENFFETKSDFFGNEGGKGFFD